MAERSTLTVERNVPATMRDGTVLYADVYRPAGPGPYPVALQRTPYDKSLAPQPWIIRAATAGYATVIQDVRGRYASEGDFTTFVNERSDGFDTLEWLSSEPWSDGNVGMFGGSYVGLTQWQTALNNHPALKAIIPVVTASNYHDGWTYQGGAFELQFNVSWILTALALNTAMRAHEGGINSAVAQALVDDHEAMAAAFERLPLSSSELPFAAYARYYDDWVNHPSYDDFWKSLDVRQGYDSMGVAALNIGGWHDIFLGGTIENYTGMRSKSPVGGHQNLLIGPWNHGGMRAGNPIGGWNFGMRSTGAYIDEGAIQLRWYDRWLRGVDNGVENDPPVRIYVMGANIWRSENEWPLARTDWQSWYFHSAGKANSLNGDGVLSREDPGDQPPDSYVYNPRNPVPTAGGGLCCNSVYALGGPQDQRSVEAREDVLVYSTPPLQEAIEVTGPIKVVLHASSSAPDTDFTAKLVDVHPCGYARNLTDGIIRARYRNSMSESSLVTPGEIVTYEIDMWSTSNSFQPGHQIRVEISSSNYPRFDRNPNTGEQPGRSTEMVSALQNVFHSSIHASHIVLPVIPAK